MEYADQPRGIPAIGLCLYAFFSKKYPFSIDTRVYTSEHRNGLHNHDFPQFWYCLSGKYLHWVDGQEYECAVGPVVTVPPGVVHRILIPEGVQAEVLCGSVNYDIFLDTPPEAYTNAIALLFLQPFSKELGYVFPRYTVLSYASRVVFEDITSWLSALSFHLPGKTTYMDIYNKLEELFSIPEFVLPEKYRDKAVQIAQTRLRPIIRTLCYMNTHYPEKIVEENLLQAAAICHTDFYRYFKRFTGYTSSVYLQRLRTQWAYAYLLYTSFPLSYISDICGFADAAHMSRIYNKYMQATPRVSRIEKKKLYGSKTEHKLQMPKF